MLENLLLEFNLQYIILQCLTMEYTYESKS